MEEMNQNASAHQIIGTVQNILSTTNILFDLLQLLNSRSQVIHIGSEVQMGTCLCLNRAEEENDFLLPLVFIPRVRGTITQKMMGLLSYNGGNGPVVRGGEDERGHYIELCRVRNWL